MGSSPLRSVLLLLFVSLLTACSSNEEPAAAPEPTSNTAPEATVDDEAGDEIESSVSVTDGEDIQSTAEVRVREIISDYDGRQTDQGTVLTVPAEVLFDFDEDSLRPDAQGTLVEVVEVLEFYEDAPVEVVGHTDSRGSASYNDALSMRRAEAVVAHLEGAGIDRSRLTVDGRGAREPVASNDTDDGRQQNRRVEVLVRGVTPPDTDE